MSLWVCWRSEMIQYVRIAALLFMAAATHAADWHPDRTVELIVGTAPGGGSDATARLVQRLFQDKKLFERPATVLNKVGGGCGATTVTCARHSAHVDRAGC